VQASRLRARSAVLHAVRAWFARNGFLEINVPTLVASPAIEPELHAPELDGMFLQTSPEFALKRVLAEGLPRVYSVCPCFRKEEWGPMHTSEFTMVEWYRAGSGYRDAMHDTVELIRAAAEAVGSPVPSVNYIEYTEAMVRHSGAGRVPVDPVERQRAWVSDVEQKLDGLTVVYDYPADESAFAEIRGTVCERFEVYWNGVELANAFTELLCARELSERWAACNRDRRAEGRAPYPVDHRLLDAVGRHPRASGVALGLDRLLLVLLGLDDIRECQVPG
jgi:lysyl-tRNA synthetase class 2